VIFEFLGWSKNLTMSKTNNLPEITRKGIRHQNVEDYLLITLLSFALSVSLTRLFLELTGYPQLGGGELHIAHVLWGGLFLFVASLLPLIFVNRWVYRWSALLSGFGVGLFIDEVGKFITQNNDYFYPAAAPVIYVFFLLIVLVYVIVRRPQPRTPRGEFYHVLKDLEEVLDRDLSDIELARIHDRLSRILRDSGDPVLIEFAANLMRFLESDELVLRSEKPNLLQRWLQRLSQNEARYLPRNRFRAILSGGLGAWGIWAILLPVYITIHLSQSAEIEKMLTELVANRLVRDVISWSLFETRVGLQGAIGLLSLVGAILLWTKERRGIYIGYMSMLVSLTVVNPLLFYFEQFSAIINALIQFVLLIGILRYRKRYLLS